MPSTRTQKKTWEEKWGPLIGVGVPLAMLGTMYGARAWARKAIGGYKPSWQRAADAESARVAENAARVAAGKASMGAKPRFTPEQAHDILGVKPGVAAEELKAKYKQMATEWHPDSMAGRGIDPSQAPEFTKKFQDIGEAFTTLKGHYKYSSLIEMQSFFETVMERW